MPTYLVAPPPPQVRMAFMDALEEEEISYAREPEGYLIFSRETQHEAWEKIRQRFQARVVEEDPVILFEP